MAQDSASLLSDLPRLTLPGAVLAVPLRVNAPALVLISGLNLVLALCLAPILLFGF